MPKTGEQKTGEGPTGDTAGRDPDWLLDSTPLTTVRAATATWQTLSLSVRASKSLRDGTLEPLRQGSGKFDVVEASDGSYSVVARADTDNAVDLRPPADLDPPLKAGTYYVESYGDRFADQAGEAYDVELSFVRASNRSPEGLPQTQTGRTGEHKTGERRTGDGFRSSNEWAFQLRNRVIRTKRVTVDVAQDTGGEPDIDAVSLTLVLDPDDAVSIHRAATRLAGSHVQAVPDGSNQPVDDTADGLNTLDLTIPDGEDVPPEGSYVIRDWTSNWRTAESWSVSVSLLKL